MNWTKESLEGLTFGNAVALLKGDGYTYEDYGIDSQKGFEIFYRKASNLVRLTITEYRDSSIVSAAQMCKGSKND